MGQNSPVRFVYRMFRDEETFLYGVSCYDEDGNVLKSIDNIGEKSVTEEFCRVLNEYEVYPCHFEELYYDYFG